MRQHNHAMETEDKFFERILYRFFIAAVKFFSEPALYFISKAAGDLMYVLAGKRRKLAVKNWTIAFKDNLSSREIQKKTRLVFREITWSLFELAILIYKRKDIRQTLSDNVSVEGLEYLETALKNNKGVICNSAHFGNFTLLQAKFASMGYPCKAISRARKTAFGTQYWHDAQKKFDLESIPARPRIQAVSASLRWLKKGNMLFLYTDQNRKKDGVCVDFFNHPAFTVKGPAMFHLRAGAEILCAFIIRVDRMKHKVVITPPLQTPKTGNLEKDVWLVTQAYTNIIEDFVRQYPMQWWWPHKRWAKNIHLDFKTVKPA